MIASGLGDAKWLRKSELVLIFSGCITGNPSSSAFPLTGEAVNSSPRPRGLSGWVTTSLRFSPAAASFSSVGTAKRGVPQKTRLKESLIGCEDYRINDLETLSTINILKIAARRAPVGHLPCLEGYQSPAFTSLRILRLMRSRFSALRWLR